MSGLSVVIAVVLRMGFAEHGQIQQYATELAVAVALFVIVACPTFHFLGMYRGVWRYASIIDLLSIVKASTLSVLIFGLSLPLFGLMPSFGWTGLTIQWLVLIFLLGGSRFAYRLMRQKPWFASCVDEESCVPVLLFGSGNNAALFLHALNADRDAAYRVVGILDEQANQHGRRIHGTPVLGGLSDLEAVVEALDRTGDRPQRLIISEPTLLTNENVMGSLLERGQQVGVSVANLPSLLEFRDAIDDGAIPLRPIALEDLLRRPEARLDREAIRALVQDRRVLITGAGGTIGKELVLQICGLGPAHVCLVETGEFALYSVDQEVSKRFPELRSEAVLCNVRERDRVMQVFEEFGPELVFHAAALKHVPLVEMNPSEGVLTNVVGTQNVADAAKMHGALAMVQVSTDKAVNPANIMGATKRIAECYCQALDLTSDDQRCASKPTRFITVRFGNVLGSSGSVVPLFERQLREGGPLTVTHPEIERFFMTVKEAVELVLQASASGLENQSARGQVFVLDMGKSHKIVDVAQQIIRLAGMSPGRDVQIVFTGLRPGEKLREELFDRSELRLGSVSASVFAAKSKPMDLVALRATIDRLHSESLRNDELLIHRTIKSLLPNYAPVKRTKTPRSSPGKIIFERSSGRSAAGEGLIGLKESTLTSGEAKQNGEDVEEREVF